MKKNRTYCNKKYAYKGIEEKKVISLLGENLLRRARYRSEDGHEYYPLDERLGLSRLMASKRFGKVVSQLTIFMPEEHVKKQLQSLLNIMVSVTFIGQLVTRLGSTLHS